MNLFSSNLFKTFTLAFAVIFSFYAADVVFAAQGVGIQDKPNQVHDISIVNKVDKDGDGRVSDFDIRLEVSSETFKFPSKKFRKIKNGVAEGVETFTPLPANWLSGLTYQAKLAPEFCVAAGKKPIPVRDWWLPDSKNTTITKDFNVSSNKFVDTNSGRESLGMQIESGDKNTLSSIEVKTHYKAIEESGIKPPTGKVTVNNPTDEMKRVLNHPCGISSLKEVFLLSPDKEIKLEPPEKDKTGRVRFLSETDGVEIFVNGESIGTTPLVESFPVDVGKVKIKAKKEAYTTKSKTKKLNPTSNASQIVRFDLDRIKKPIVIKTKPKGASINMNGGVTADKTPHTLKTWIKRSPTITVTKDSKSKTFRNVNPPATLEADLTSDSVNLGKNIYNNLNYNQIPDINYNEIVPPSLNIDPIKAKFSAAPTSTKTKNEIDFDASASYSLGAKVQDYNWDFGDGSSSKGRQVKHSYSNSGDYEVKLTIADSNGKTNEISKTVRIENRKPQANFSISQQQARPGEEIKLDASSSSDPDGSIDKFEWSFNGNNQKNGAEVTHSFSSPGGYKVELKVTDSAGDTAVESMNISVKAENKPPQAQIKLAKDKIAVGDKFMLDGSGSSDPDGVIKNYNWLIENEKYLAGVTTSHKFSTTGTKEIKLSVTDFNSDKNKTSTTIEVVSSQEKVDTTKQQNSENEEEKGLFERIIDWIKSLFE